MLKNRLVQTMELRSIDVRSPTAGWMGVTH